MTISERRVILFICIVLLTGSIIRLVPRSSYVTAGEETEHLSRVHLNTARFDELLTVSGIGRVTARRIIEFRRENGPFLSLEALTEVNGIGEKKLEKLKRFLQL